MGNVFGKTEEKETFLCVVVHRRGAIREEMTLSLREKIVWLKGPKLPPWKNLTQLPPASLGSEWNCVSGSPGRRQRGQKGQGDKSVPGRGGEGVREGTSEPTQGVPVC